MFTYVTSPTTATPAYTYGYPAYGHTPSASSHTGLPGQSFHMINVEGNVKLNKLNKLEGELRKNPWNATAMQAYLNEIRAQQAGLNMTHSTHTFHGPWPNQFHGWLQPTAQWVQNISHLPYVQPLWQCVDQRVCRPLYQHARTYL